MRRFLVVAVVLALFTVSAACGGDDGGGDAEESRSSDDEGFEMDFDDDDDDGEDVDNDEVIENIQEFWEDRSGDVGHQYEELPDERIVAIPGDEPPTCGGVEIQPSDVEQNAFAAPCPEGLTVAWDPELIDGTLTDLFGGAGPAVVFAHEWGHILQFQTGILDVTGQGIGNPSSVLVENQADCFSGAWVGQQVEDGFGAFSNTGALDDAIGAMLFVRDVPGSDPNDPRAHGSGFDRVRAFQDGYDRGIEYCFGYIEDPPFIDQLPFTEADAANQGNLPFDEVVELVIQDLDTFWEANVDGFESPGDPFDVVPQEDLEELHGEVGDASVAAVLAMLWAQEAQEAAGDDVDGEGPLLQRSCLVGAWLGDILRDQQDGTADRESGASLSPGDLDEVIITFLRLFDDAMSEAGIGFEAIFDMRLGVFGGVEDCRLGE